MTASPPRVSVILPTRDRSAVLVGAIESVRAQTVEEFELIVVDDGSSEDIASVVTAFADQRLRVVRSAVNLGVAGAQNLGLEHAHGAYVAFLHSDDRWLPDKLADELALLDACDDEVCGVESASLVNGRNGLEPLPPRLRGVGVQEMLEFAVGVQIVPFLFRRSALGERPFDPRLRAWEDWDLLLRLLRSRRFVFNPRPAVIITQSGDERLSASPWMLDGLETLRTKHGAEIEASRELVARWAFKAFRASQRLGRGESARRWLEAAFHARPTSRLRVLVLAARLGAPALGAAWALYRLAGSWRATVGADRSRQRRLRSLRRRLDPRVWARQLYVTSRGLRQANRIPTHLKVKEKVHLYRLARSLAGRSLVAVEVGSYLGASACFLAAGLGERGRLICVDTWHNETMPEGPCDTFAQFRRNVAPYGNLTAFRGASHEVFVELARTAPAVDLLFLDGDHSYEACLRDWQLYSQLLRTGSLVAFHDIAWAEGVQAVVTGPASAVATRLPGLPNLAVMRYHGGIEP